MIEIHKLIEEIGLNKKDGIVFLDTFEGLSDITYMSLDGYDLLMDYSNAAEDMPYGTQKARDGDPYEWLFTYFENLIADPLIEGAREYA